MYILARYVRMVEGFNYRVGRFAMYLIFVMMAVLLWSSITKVSPFMRPSLWTLEIAQFLMVAYYILGGPYSIQLNSNVRMDLGYGVLSQKNKALVDAFTIFFLVIYLGFLLVGALNSFSYSLGNFRQEAVPFLLGVVKAFFTNGIEGATAEFGVLERSRSIWRAPMWPIKLIMIIGILLMLLQASAEFIKDIARMKTGLEDPFNTAPKNRNLN
ncbi:TRAP transporter small permease subunit [Granulosicoccus sp.]|nr:TRAP transporter small permease subunit [Granulosicoccus sp.]MDB4222574.1 TRAP transporter small permease subunit [Granulosicoccus sp.]